IGTLGVDAEEANRNTLNQGILLQDIENRRQSVSGVFQDEELANMVRFQHAYNASARMITTMDEMLDVLINRVGIVGR
ncbi:MAG: flagellar hook-associated protein FlgK, partial [Clostridiales bacterium]|nr:flagellar hook-associated protein FlgK [Clostridiales bacterium]